MENYISELTAKVKKKEISVFVASQEFEKVTLDCNEIIKPLLKTGNRNLAQILNSKLIELRAAIQERVAMEGKV